MIYKHYIVKATILSFALLFVSCYTRTPNTIGMSDLNISKEENFQIVDSIAIPLPFNLWDWKILKDSTIVFFSQDMDSYCTIFDCKNSSIKYTMAQKGKGNEEYLTCNWCKITDTNRIALYDIMRKTLNVYIIEEYEYKKVASYLLPTDKDGLTRPYTNILRYDGSIFLMKEDGTETNLRLVDLNDNNEIASYHCSFRDGKEGSYTPYDYLFHVINDKIIIAYCYYDRIEILQINENGISPISIYGEDNSFMIPENYDELKYHSLYIETKENNFYILRSSDGGEDGDEILVFNVDDNDFSLIKLQNKIKLFGFDSDDNLLGYNESDAGTIIYRYKPFKTVLKTNSK